MCMQVALKLFLVEADQEPPSLQIFGHAMMLGLTDFEPKLSLLARLITSFELCPACNARQGRNTGHADSGVHAGGAEAVLGGGRAGAAMPGRLRLKMMCQSHCLPCCLSICDPQRYKDTYC